MANKLMTSTELAGIVRTRKTSGDKVGFTNGCFDILHVGHVRYLKEARRMCDILIVGLNSDASVKNIKGEGRPVNLQGLRAEVLGSLESVDYLTIFDEDTPERLIKDLSPDILFKGGDWKEKDVVGGEYVRSKGGSVRIIPFEDGFSTTAMIKKINLLN